MQNAEWPPSDLTPWTLTLENIVVKALFFSEIK